VAEPIIKFNNATGSDTAASGAGPGTAVTGTAAAHTNGSASTTITLTNSPDLSGVPTDGSAAIWLKTGSGRQFSKITAVDNGAKTVTVGDSFNIASGSAVDYAIGGKRKTIDNADSRTLFGATGAKSGWVIEIEDDQSLTSALSVAFGTGPVTVRGTGGTRPTITQTANAANFTLSGSGTLVVIEFLRFINTNGTKSSAHGLFKNSTIDGFRVRDCVFGSTVTGDRLQIGINETSGDDFNQVYDCHVLNCVSNGIVASRRGTIFGCLIENCGGEGFVQSGNVQNVPVLISCIIRGNGGHGLSINTNGSSQKDPLLIFGCTIHGNTNSGIIFTNANKPRANVYNNNITGNGGWGITGVVADSLFEDYNNFGTGSTANTSGEINGVTKGANSTAVDPQYADPANGNMAVGANLRAQGFPDKDRTIGANAGATRTYVDIGAAQRQEVQGGGPLVI
jgi:hypothetical protein